MKTLPQDQSDFNPNTATEAIDSTNEKPLFNELKDGAYSKVTFDFLSYKNPDLLMLITEPEDQVSK
jgi:hypothetical protein